MQEEVYFTDRGNATNFLIETLGLQESDAEDFDMCLTDFQEESYKRSTLCSGYIHDRKRDIYFAVRFTNDYDWGNSDFYIDPTPNKREEYEETVVVKKVKYTEVKEKL